MNQVERGQWDVVKFINVKLEVTVFVSELL